MSPVSTHDPASGSVADAPRVAEPRFVIPEWIGMVARGAIAVVVAIFITFSADHSAELGFRMFAIFALVSGAVVLLMALRSPDSSRHRAWFAAQGALGIAAGVVAALSSAAGIPFLLFLVSCWAALTGAIELVTGLRARGRIAQARDWVFAGALTAAFAVAVLLIPAGYNEPYTGPDEVVRYLTSSVILVGALGAYAAIHGVFLLIAASSLRWPVKVPATPVAESEKLP